VCDGTMIEEDAYMAALAVYIGNFWLDERARVTNTRSQDPTTRGYTGLAQLPRPLLYVAWAERNPYWKRISSAGYEC
jgi:hypothetical protein